MLAVENMGAGQKLVNPRGARRWVRPSANCFVILLTAECPDAMNASKYLPVQ
jgi:hypothetical protein